MYQKSKISRGIKMIGSLLLFAAALSLTLSTSANAQTDDPDRESWQKCGLEILRRSTDPLPTGLGLPLLKKLDVSADELQMLIHVLRVNR